MGTKFHTTPKPYLLPEWKARLDLSFKCIIIVIEASIVADTIIANRGVLLK